MRIYKRLPFSMPNSVKVNDLVTKCERLERTIDDLQNIRSHIVQGTMTRELYDFINMDGSLESLMCDLPRPSNTVACEALSEAQLIFVDEAIEALGASWKEIVRQMWLSIKEWLLDWFDINRLIKFDIQKMKAVYQSNPSFFGDIRSFEAITMRAYHKPYWEDMVNACSSLNEKLKTIPQNSESLNQWIKSNESIIASCLGQFGHSVVNPGPRIIEGNPVHDRVITSLGAARWRFNLLEQDMTKCINILSDEIECRRLYSTLEHLFTGSSISDKMNLHFVRKLVMLGKANTFVVARGLRTILKTASGRKKIPDQTTKIV